MAKSPGSVTWVELVFVAALGALALLFSSSSATRTWRTRAEAIDRSSDVPVLVSLRNRLAPRVIRGSEDTGPASGEDFLLFVWIKPSRLPATRSRAIAVVKFDPQQITRPGFGIGLARKEGGVWPEVYWKGNSVRGGWYSFPELEYVPHAWALLALSYRADRFLGLHAVVRTPGKEARLVVLGGHVVDGSAPPNARVPIDVGAVGGGSSFRGDIGPVGIVAGQGLAEHLPRLLMALYQEPSSVPHLPPSLRVVSFTADPSALRKGEDSQ